MNHVTRLAAQRTKTQVTRTRASAPSCNAPRRSDGLDSRRMARQVKPSPENAASASIVEHAQAYSSTHRTSGNFHLMEAKRSCEPGGGSNRDGGRAAGLCGNLVPTNERGMNGQNNLDDHVRDRRSEASLNSKVAGLSHAWGSGVETVTNLSFVNRIYRRLSRTDPASTGREGG